MAFAAVAVSAAPKPGIFAAPLAVAPAVAPAVVTAQSSQVVARNFNALAAPLVAAAPVVAAPAVAAPVLAHSAPLLAAPAPYVASAYSPYLI